MTFNSEMYVLKITIEINAMSVGHICKAVK